MIRVPGSPSGRLTDALRHRAGTGRLGLAPRSDHQDPELLDAPREAAEPPHSHRPPTAEDGRAAPFTLSRHRVPLVEPTPVGDEPPPRWDERHPLGREAAA
ncbi:hypothetical protein [Streptomyces sp. Go-475]|uniref:hypothetical protein n=1 Tax=Streptomyces sp. Go-475 TaxID=2072505 RepID=UPI000DEF00A6|nr:hypothetical protein [Streptomyces sp. Go-475]AXE89299.1 hypothetical protein C1703_30220 [Streptomyces sp. Go-475]